MVTANTLRDRIDEFGTIIDSLDKILKGDPDALTMDVEELARDRMAEVKRLRRERDLLLVACKHATLLISNEANTTVQAYAIVNQMANSLQAAFESHLEDPKPDG